MVFQFDFLIQITLMCSWYSISQLFISFLYQQHFNFKILEKEKLTNHRMFYCSIRLEASNSYHSYLNKEKIFKNKPKWMLKAVRQMDETEWYQTNNQANFKRWDWIYWLCFLINKIKTTNWSHKNYWIHSVL